eukprot:TRINITY_DN9246_c0_g1_i3.p1 TRINITY_DN9246_c0_g1~~TRINITY_DN9246_c0_g1_i3.p1  ORF type:complete len:221 (-),score=31.65 TRINITY_DN9246_c0_g1_i3:88-750(-)
MCIRDRWYQRRVRGNFFSVAMARLQMLKYLGVAVGSCLFAVLCMHGPSSTSSSTTLCMHGRPLPTNASVKLARVLKRAPGPAGSNPACNDLKRRGRSRKLFLDVGSNRGDVLYAFFNRKHPKGSTNPLWKFDVPGYDPAEWEVFGFEASPSHYKTLLDAQYNATLIFGALWNVSGAMVELQADEAGKAEWGSSLVKRVSGKKAYNAVSYTHLTLPTKRIV